MLSGYWRFDPNGSSGRGVRLTTPLPRVPTLGLLDYTLTPKYAFLTWGRVVLFLCSDVYRLMASNERMTSELMVKYVIGIGRGLTRWYVKKAKSPDNLNVL